jgi:cytochrome b561
MAPIGLLAATARIGMNTTTNHPAHFSASMRAIHWLILVLIAATYSAAWVAHSGLAGEWFRPIFDLHRSLGLTVLVLTAFRLFWRQRTHIPRLPGDLHPLQKVAARGTETLLYLLLFVQPLLGLLQTSARGQPVNFYLLISLPPVIETDRPLARQLHDLHALSANALLVLIAMHSAAALFHHFIRRDDVLNAMLPTRLFDIGRARFALLRPKRQT